MMKKRYLAALGAFSSALAACSGEVGGGNAGTGAASAVGGSGATASGGSSATGTGGTGTGGASGGSAPTGGTAGAGAGTTGGAGGATGGSAGVGAAGTGAATCVPGIPTSSQIPRLLNRQYDAAVRDLLGITTLTDGKLPSDELYPDFDGPLNTDAWRFYQDVGAKIAAQVMAGANKAMFINCDPAAAGCLTNTIKDFGRKAFRRPLTPDEEASFARLGALTPAGTPAEVAEATLYAFLVSPSFLQITELTQEQEAGAIKLSQYEVAARLSFLLWGSVPDDALNVAADSNQLTTKEQILAQAERMIAVREKTAPLIAGFHRSYLEMDNADAHWWKVDHDKTKYPLYAGEDVKTTYAEELDDFFEDVAFSGGTFKDLFLSSVAYVNNATAALYGLDPAAYGPTLTRVELDPATRPGFLTRLGFLSSYSHYDSSSPILRGAFITVNIIGVNPGAPDPNFFLTPPPEGTYNTERAYTEALTDQPNCRGCHIPYVNPPGFALENFDSIGAWQTVDPRANGDAVAGAIDTTVDVTFSEGNTKTVNGPLELMQGIVETPAAKRIYAEKWVTFATGRLPNANDACTVDMLDINLSTDGYTVLNLLADLTQADSFRLRVRATP